MPTLAVWKFASCDGCQLTLLDCEDELLAVADQVRIAHFLEATREVLPGPYDVSLVEGSITTPEDAERIRRVREMSGILVTIGACATAGGVQALRNYADVAEFTSVVYAHPEYVSTLATSTPIAAHVDVDYELHGCPIDRRQLLEVITSLLVGRKPNIPAHSVCFECKQLDPDGLLVTARIVPPTSQNQAAIEDDLARFVEARLDLDDERLTHECEQAIRNYDPCISCATHFLGLSVDRG